MRRRPNAAAPSEPGVGLGGACETTCKRRRVKQTAEFQQSSCKDLFKDREHVKTAVNRVDSGKAGFPFPLARGALEDVQPAFMPSRFPWLSGCPAVQLSGCPAVRLSGCLGHGGHGGRADTTGWRAVYAAVLRRKGSRERNKCFTDAGIEIRPLSYLRFLKA